MDTLIGPKSFESRNTPLTVFGRSFLATLFVCRFLVSVLSDTIFSFSSHWNTDMCLLNARTRADGYGCDQKYPGTSLERAKGLGYYQQVGVGSGNGLRLKRAVA